MADMRRWVQSRRSDSVATAVLWVTLVQLSIGVIYVRAARAQTPSQDVINDRLVNRANSIELRVYELEQLRLPERLALLEQSTKVSEESWTEVRRIGYGIVSGVIGLIAAQIVQIRGQRRNRKAEE
jgi:hypothetical protein